MSETSIRVIDIDGHVREADDLWERYSLKASAITESPMSLPFK